MRAAVCGALVVAGLVAVSWLVGLPAGVVRAERLAGHESAVAAGLIAHSTTLGDHQQQLTVVDPELRVIGVYHIDAHGEIVLKSVRNIHWDLQLTDFNTANPLPREIRALQKK